MSVNIYVEDTEDWTKGDGSPTDAYTKSESDARYVKRSDCANLSVTTTVASGGTVSAYRCGSVAVISFADYTYAYTGGATQLATVTLDNGWKVFSADGNVRTILTSNGDPLGGIKIWTDGKDTSTINIWCWAAGVRNIGEGAAELVIPLYHD